jgi:hypothetical protein
MDGGFGEAELSGDYPYAFTLPLELSSALTVDHYRGGPRVLPSFSLVASGCKTIFVGAPGVQNLNFLAAFCGLLRTVNR